MRGRSISRSRRRSGRSSRRAALRRRAGATAAACRTRPDADSSSMAARAMGITEKGLYALDLEPGHETWTKLDLPNAPPLRSSGFGFATPQGDVTCAFGNDKKGMSDVAFLGYAP